MKNKIVGILIAIITLLGGGVYTGTKLGSVPISNEYHSTTTVSGFQNSIPLQTGRGSLGSFVVTLAGTGGTLSLLDATTTNASLRASSKATSTITIASIPNALAVGTYVFDVIFTDGLYYDCVGCTVVATSTITWR